MKNGKNPTKRQQEIIKAAGWNPDMWFVSKHTSTELHLLHRYIGSTVVIPL